MTEPARVERRRRRHDQTVQEILDVAAAIMGEEGVAGLSLGEVARRMQIRTPSLYTYFPSKNALYDALFRRGWTLLDAAMAEHWTANGNPSAAALAAGVTAFTRWAVEHPAYAQLMFWRPVPGYRPSESAYAAALAVRARLQDAVAGLQRSGVLRDDVDAEAATTDLTVLVSGVISQQLANAPDEPVDGGTFTERLPELVSMYLAHYGHHSPGGKHDHPTPSRSRRGTAANVPEGGAGGGAPAVRRARGATARTHRR